MPYFVLSFCNHAQHSTIVTIYQAILIGLGTYLCFLSILYVYLVCVVLCDVNYIQNKITPKIDIVVVTSLFLNG